MKRSWQDSLRSKIVIVDKVRRHDLSRAPSVPMSFSDRVFLFVFLKTEPILLKATHAIDHVWNWALCRSNV